MKKKTDKDWLLSMHLNIINHKLKLLYLGSRQIISTITIYFLLTKNFQVIRTIA